MRVLLALTQIVAVLAGLVACSAEGPRPITRRPPLTVADPQPPGVSGTPTAEAPPPECGPGSTFNPRASSLRPLVPHPKPGAMPAGSTMARIVANGRLVAGVDQNLNLFSSRNPSTGELEGFDVDVVRRIAAALFGDPTKFQLRAVNFTDNFSVLNRSEVDILVDSITITCERRFGKQVWFSTDYFDSGQKVMVSNRSPYKSVDDLGGKKVCAPANTTSIRTIAQYPKAKLVPVPVPEFSDCLVLLQQGQVDAMSSTDSVMLGMIAQDPTMTMVGDRFTDEPHGIAVRQGEPDMIRFVNGVLEQMRADGSWTQLYTKWLKGLDPVVPQPPVAQYLEGS